MSYTPESLAADITEWQSITTWLSQAKEKEMALRLKLAHHFFANKIQPNGALPEGTSKTEADGLKVKVVGKVNRTVLEEMRELVVQEAKLTAEEAKALFKLKAELSVSQYKNLSDAQKAIVDRAIVAKPGACELSIEKV